MSLSHQKVKSVAKIMTTRREGGLDKKIAETLRTASDLVGATLGPGGMSVIIERQESGLPPIATKDGVSVYKALGFQDATKQVLMEAAREASIRTAAEAGDGTTTATILSESFVSNIQAFTTEMPHLSNQLVTRRLTQMFQTYLQGVLQSRVLPCDMADNRQRLWNVARISANGDVPLADAVLECFDIVGDEGNVTISEASGPSDYRVEKIEGFPISMGYEESCGVFFTEFINDPATQQCVLKKPLWILNHGIFNDYNEIFSPSMAIADAASEGKVSPAVVVVATGFSESFRAQCAASFKTTGAIRVFPLLAPRTIQKTSQQDFLEDLAALTGATVFNPLTQPIEAWTDLSDFGMDGPSSFESSRFRSSVVGYGDELLVLERVQALDAQLTSEITSELDRQLLRERKAKLTSGIARLIVRGSSNAEVKERRDRAEDAVCAVRSAIKYGALVGGGMSWVALSNLKADGMTGLDSEIFEKIIKPSVLAPVQRLFRNAGHTDDEISAFIQAMSHSGLPYDLGANKWLKVGDETLLDSFSAVRDALRNSISVANLLGACGGAVVFARDSDLERREAIEAFEYTKAANAANERG